MRFYLLTILLALFLSTPTTLTAQALPTIQELMTSSEYRSAGLSKLSEAEIQRLNDWLHSYTMQIFEIASTQLSNSTARVIESQIEGEFVGWEGETIFKLTNGQIWQQSQFAYRYHYAFRPKVTIVQTNSGYKMTVDGVSGSIFVKRLK